MAEYKYIPPPENASNVTPSEARSLFRRNGYYGHTSGFSSGYSQANVVVLPREVADEFEEFCKKNSVPLPLLYRSQPGECSAPPIAQNSDIKTDLPRYIIYSNGKHVEDILDLCGFEKSWDDRVTFYLGCSFTFESALNDRGIKVRNMDQGKDVSMYLSNIRLKEIRPFKAQMIVSMRPMKRADLEEVFRVTSQYPDSHGGPIHIGDPYRIGVTDIAHPTSGDPTAMEEDDVPVFWGCGFTVGQAVTGAAPSLAFTHYPGSMFITDIQPEPKHIEDKIKVIQLSRASQPFFASVLEEQFIDTITKMEKVILEDPGRRGIVNLYQESDLLKAVLALSHAKTVAVTTGFPVRPVCPADNTELDVKAETDGLPGALSICQALLTLGKEVILIFDSDSVNLYKSCVNHMTEEGVFQSPIDVISSIKALEMCQGEKEVPWDCLVAIERAGKASDGSYRTMHAKTLIVESLDDVFVKALSNPLVSTIGIGDGGNELGMGKVYKAVVDHVQFGDEIGCVTISDYLIAAGVSNWAGYAISLGLYVVSCCSPVHWRYRNYGVDADTTPKFDVKDFLPTANQTSELLRYMNELGICDGRSGTKDQSVDGLPLQVHLDKVTELVDCIKL